MQIKINNINEEKTEVVFSEVNLKSAKERRAMLRNVRSLFRNYNSKMLNKILKRLRDYQNSKNQK